MRTYRSVSSGEEITLDQWGFLQSVLCNYELLEMTELSKDKQKHFGFTNKTYLKYLKSIQVVANSLNNGNIIFIDVYLISNKKTLGLPGCGNSHFLFQHCFVPLARTVIHQKDTSNGLINYLLLDFQTQDYFLTVTVGLIVNLELKNPLLKFQQ